MSDLLQLAAAVRDVAAHAGRTIERIRAGSVTSVAKADLSPVTEADHAADAELHDGLLRLVNCGWLSEETADSPARLDLERLWVVDPLDGTKEFIAGIPEYSVAVALVESGRPVLGVVHNPATRETFWAAAGAGAYRGDERIAVSEGRRLLASRSEMKRGEFAPFEDGWDVVHTGSIEYKLGLIAAGTAAVTLSRGPKWEWDVCAGSLIVTEAGGVATDVFGDTLTFNRPFPKVKGILAGAPEAYRTALTQVAAMGASDRMREMEGR
jgi:myo-inositol-1(or 4)-monophosphatase